MDLKAIHRIFTEEKANLDIQLPHAIKSYAGPAGVQGSKFLGSDDAFQIKVDRGTIQLICNREKTPRLTEKEIRLMTRHELCHILDHLDRKIGHEFFGFAEDGAALFEAVLMNAILAETQKAYFEFLMAKRYIELFGLEEFKEQNEIGMDAFIDLVNSTIANLERRQNRLFAYTIFGAIYGTFKETVKIDFYNPRDRRFPPGTWQIVEWLIEDFDFIESLKAQWRKTSSLLSFEALVMFENIEIPSALDSSLSKLKGQPSWRIYTSHDTTIPLPHMLVERWGKRIHSLHLHHS